LITFLSLSDPRMPAAVPLTLDLRNSLIIL
jgi:hypothetical protein